MSDETDTQQGGAEGVDASEAVETTSEATTEQATGTEETGPADDAGEATEEAHQKRVPWFQKRINEVTAKVYQKDAEVAYWRGIAEGRGPQQQQAPQQQVEPPEPWDPGYNEWVIQQATSRFAAEQQKASVLQTFASRVEQTRQVHPDYDSVVNDPGLPITPVMADVIRESELGPDVAYHLGVNRQEAQRIAQLPPHRQAAELGKIEASLATKRAAPVQPRTPPPAPPQTLSGISAGLNKPAEDMSMAEYIAARNGGQI